MWNLPGCCKEKTGLMQVCESLWVWFVRFGVCLNTHAFTCMRLHVCSFYFWLEECGFLTIQTNKSQNCASILYEGIVHTSISIYIFYTIQEPCSSNGNPRFLQWRHPGFNSPTPNFWIIKKQKNVYILYKLFN